MYQNNFGRTLLQCQWQVKPRWKSDYYFFTPAKTLRNYNRLITKHGLRSFQSHTVARRNLSSGRTSVERNKVLGNASVNNFCYSVFEYFKRGFFKIPAILKDHSVNIVRLCTQQCECVVAQKIRRGQQMFSLYTKLWDETALKEIVKRMRQQLSKRGKEFLLSACGLSAYNWENGKIPDEKLLRHMNEIDSVYTLTDKTLMCHACGCRLVIDKPLPNKEYCKCGQNNSSNNGSSSEECSGNEWLPFIERQDILIWRQEHESLKGLYAYKVYGKYEDVSAEDFLQVQIDIDFRREWDDTAVELQIVESDPSSNSDIIYWEMQWPHMFANRDYVFNRRYLVDKNKKVIAICNEGIEHPGVPEKPGNHRVKDYWSYMIVKPFSEFNQPGIEFVLTYFDNPGISIPATVSGWVAMSGLPKFCERLREAAKKISLKKKKHPIIGDMPPIPPQEPVTGGIYLQHFHGCPSYA